VVLGGGVADVERECVTGREKERNRERKKRESIED
jgi:hypothetical protein